MKPKFTNKQIWTIAYPVMLSLLMEQLIGMTDTAFLGRLGGQAGEIALGASALGNVFYIAVFLLGFGFSIGAQIMIGRRNGEGNYSSIGPIFQQGAIFLLLLAAILFTITKLVAPLLLSSWISSPEVYEGTLVYLNWRIYSFFFGFLAGIFRAFYVGTTRTKILTANALVMLLSNVVLNYALIFGKFGLPAMGIAGAAIASSIAELVSLLFFLLYTIKWGNWRKYNLFRFSRFEPKMLGSILKISSWTMVQQFASAGTWFFFFLAVEHLGEQSLAISNLVRSISAVIFLVVGAMGTTTNTLVSNMIGAGQSNQVMGTIGRTIRFCYLIVLPLMAFILAFPDLLLRIFTNNAELIAASIPSLRVMISAAVISVPAYILFNSISGTGNTRAAFIQEVITLTVYVVFIYVVAVYLRADVAICWLSEHVYAIILLALGFTYMRSGKWQNKKI